ncbi:hypothetical protein L610_001000000640 [Aminobacter sp. J44]|nr:hypothetical protein L610_001000000640 [Aminobacter sp. J44]
MRAVGACSASLTTMSPRKMTSRPMRSPARLRAQRSPARPISDFWFWAWIERTRAGSPDGLMTMASPTRTSPLRTVPVTTVPAPCSAKERSTERRKRPASLLRPISAEAVASRSSSVATPRPVTLETGRTSAPSSPVPARSASISIWTASNRSSLTRSALVIATMPRFTPRRSRIARCSRVCGITPSSAATTSSA